MTRPRLFGPGGLFEGPSYNGAPVRTVDKLPTRFHFVTETVADWWVPGLARCWRVTIRADVVWLAMTSERVH